MLPYIAFVLDHFIGLLFRTHDEFIVRSRQICFDNSIEMQTVLLLSIKHKKENRSKSLC